MLLKIHVSLAQQTLKLINEHGECLRSYLVSTAANGAGEANGSFCTPRGRHIIRAKIGAGYPANTIFIARRPTGDIYSDAYEQTYPGRDWVLTRILWLSGCESGFNRLGNVDTMRRYIYIHASPDGTSLGVPGSHGCIRMRNEDMIDLFERVPVYTPVEIFEK